MKFHFLTIFPEMINAYLGESILARAVEKKLISFEVKNIRDFSLDKHHKVDDRPYGGGPGMVMAAEPIVRAFGKLKMKGKKTKVIMLSPSGKTFTNSVAQKFAKRYTNIIFICGRYEGVDDRVRQILKADEYSVGDYTVTGGELPALIMADAISRQIPGVLGKSRSVEENRVASPRVYTRPEIFIYKTKKYKVPKVLVEGHHQKIEDWRHQQKNK